MRCKGVHSSSAAKRRVHAIARAKKWRAKFRIGFRATRPKVPLATHTRKPHSCKDGFGEWPALFVMCFSYPYVFYAKSWALSVALAECTPPVSRVVGSCPRRSPPLRSPAPACADGCDGRHCRAQGRRAPDGFREGRRRHAGRDCQGEHVLVFRLDVRAPPALRRPSRARARFSTRRLLLNPRPRSPLCAASRRLRRWTSTASRRRPAC